MEYNFLFESIFIQVLLITLGTMGTWPAFIIKTFILYCSFVITDFEFLCNIFSLSFCDVPMYFKYTFSTYSI